MSALGPPPPAGDVVGAFDRVDPTEQLSGHSRCSPHGSDRPWSRPGPRVGGTRTVSSPHAAGPLRRPRAGATGQLTQVRRRLAAGEGSGAYAGGPVPGLSFETAGWLHRTEIVAVPTDTWGVEVRPNEWPNAMPPLHQVALPHIGLLLGEMWDLDELVTDCAQDGAYEFLLAAQPLPFTRAVGSPVNPVAVK